MACVNVYCPRCDSALVYRHSQNPKGQSCFLCRECCSVFQLTYTYQARKPGVKGLIVDMAFNGAGIRDTARTPKVGINTCLDTNDFIRRYDLVIDELLDATDLVDAGSETRRTTISTKALVGVSNWRMLECARYLAKRNQHTWVGYVIVPVWSDDDKSAHMLGEFTQNMINIEKIELLPYHQLGKHKWEVMGEKYTLDGVQPPKPDTMDNLKAILESYSHKVMY